MVSVKYFCRNDDGEVEYLTVIAENETDAFSKLIKWGLNNGKVKYNAIETVKIMPYSDNPAELVELYKDVPQDKTPLYIFAIEWGLDCGINIPPIYNGDVGLTYGDSHFTKEFQEFYQNWCDENFLPKTKMDCN